MKNFARGVSGASIRRGLRGIADRIGIRGAMFVLVFSGLVAAAVIADADDTQVFVNAIAVAYGAVMTIIYSPWATSLMLTLAGVRMRSPKKVLLREAAALEKRATRRIRRSYGYDAQARAWMREVAALRERAGMAREVGERRRLRGEHIIGAGIVAIGLALLIPYSRASFVPPQFCGQDSGCRDLIAAAQTFFLTFGVVAALVAPFFLQPRPGEKPEPKRRLFVALGVGFALFALALIFAARNIPPEPVFPPEPPQLGPPA